MDSGRLREIADQLKSVAEELLLGESDEDDATEDHSDAEDEEIEEKVSPGIHKKVEEAKTSGEAEASKKPDKGKVNLMLAFLKKKGK